MEEYMKNKYCGNIGGYHYHFCIFEGHLEIFLDTYRTYTYDGAEYKYNDTNLSILVSLNANEDKAPKLLLYEMDFLGIREKGEYGSDGVDYFNVRTESDGNLYYCAKGINGYCVYVKIPKKILDRIIKIGMEKYERGEVKE